MFSNFYSETCLCVWVEVLRPSQPIRFMLSTVSLPYHVFLGRLSPLGSQPVLLLVHICFTKN